jgi:methylated-DNA-[protein]-cysteine S-methyltransferase
MGRRIGDRIDFFCTTFLRSFHHTISVSPPPQGLQHSDACLAVAHVRRKRHLMSHAGAVAADWRGTPAAAALTPFARAIYELTAGIPRGRVTTYGAIARALRGDGAPVGALSQAVGNALHRNPFAPSVPCHRVLRSGDPPTIGGFMGTAEAVSRKGAAGAGGAGGGAKGTGKGAGKGALAAAPALPENLARKRVLLEEEGVRFDAALRLVGAERCLLRGAADWPPEAVAAARAALAGGGGGNKGARGGGRVPAGSKRTRSAAKS